MRELANEERISPGSPVLKSQNEMGCQDCRWKEEFCRIKFKALVYLLAMKRRDRHHKEVRFFDALDPMSHDDSPAAKHLIRLDNLDREIVELQGMKSRILEDLVVKRTALKKCSQDVNYHYRTSSF